jgi:1,4-dihydroxy-2-naphthoate octaprenyltransferase
MLLGASAAAVAGPLSIGWLAVTALGIFAVEVAKNASGEVFDWDSGTDLRIRPEDRSPFSGGKRVLVDGLLTRRQTWAIAITAYLLAILVGLAIVRWRESEVLWVGVAGLALAFFYHAPPLRLSYHGLGELAVAAAYGPLICAGTYMVQRGVIPTAIVLLSLPLGLLVAAFLWINEFPDCAADALSGKRTLVVRLGRRGAAKGFALIGMASAVVLALLPAAGLPRTVWLGGVAAARYLPAARTLLASPEDTPSVVPAQAMTLEAFLLYAVGTSAGMWLGG